MQPSATRLAAASLLLALLFTFSTLLTFAQGDDPQDEPTPTPDPETEADAIDLDSEDPPQTLDGGWELVWSDEFSAEAGTPINDAFWTCEQGGHGWGNQQLEYDTNRVENVVHDGAGNLLIIAREEQYGVNRYTSARCNTRDKVEVMFGRIEARLDLPEGQGIWPAFWMLGAEFPGTPWPDSGEIDIMEYIGKTPRTTYGTVHGPGYSGGAGIGRQVNFSEPVADDFHVFAIEWEPGEIRWYVDGERFFRLAQTSMISREWVFDQPFFMIINVAVGGLWPGNPDENTVFPQEMVIDWIRVYQQAEQPGEIHLGAE